MAVKLIESRKLSAIKIENRKTNEVMKEFRLDKGEAAAYIGFDPKKHKAILTDDGELIKLCKLQNVPFICAMAAVLVMFEWKKLTKEETFDKLRQLHEIGRYSEKLYEHFKNEVK